MLDSVEQDRAQKLYDFLHEQVGDALDALRARIDGEEEMGLYLQIAMDVLAVHLGRTDAYACLGNISRDSRDAVRTKAFQEGQTSVLTEHNHNCTQGAECPDLQRVLREVLPN